MTTKELVGRLNLGEGAWEENHDKTVAEIVALIDAHIAEREVAQERVNQALIDGCNRMLAKGAQGTTADLEEYVALREAALVERIIGAVIGFYDLGFSPGQDVDLIAAIREAARRKE